jgi:hypothetical protein
MEAHLGLLRLALEGVPSGAASESVVRSNGIEMY